MKCLQCGAYFEDHLASCPFCGAPAPRQQGFAPMGGFGTFGNPGGAPMYYRPMKWYKFLIYFLLFFSAFSNCLSAVEYFTGWGYEGGASLVYSTFPMLRVLDIIAGVCALSLAVLAIVTRFSLARMKRSGPKLVLVLYAAGGLFTLLYSFGVMAIIGSFDPFEVASQIVSAGLSALIVWANFVYFRNRRDLFIC